MAAGKPRPSMFTLDGGLTQPPTGPSLGGALGGSIWHGLRYDFDAVCVHGTHCRQCRAHFCTHAWSVHLVETKNTAVQQPRPLHDIIFFVTVADVSLLMLQVSLWLHSCLGHVHGDVDFVFGMA